jgi:hypothetical protein
MFELNDFSHVYGSGMRASYIRSESNCAEEFVEGVLKNVYLLALPQSRCTG